MDTWTSNMHLRLMAQLRAQRAVCSTIRTSTSFVRVRVYPNRCPFVQLVQDAIKFLITDYEGGKTLKKVNKVKEVKYRSKYRSPTLVHALSQSPRPHPQRAAPRPRPRPRPRRALLFCLQMFSDSHNYIRLETSPLPGENCSECSAKVSPSLVA